MIESDRILDIRDKLNSLEYCLDNIIINRSVELNKSEIEDRLKNIGDELIENTSNLNKKLPLIEVLKSNKDTIEKAVKKKMTTYLSLAFKIEMLKRRLNEEGDKIKLSKHVANFIQNV